MNPLNKLVISNKRFAGPAQLGASAQLGFSFNSILDNLQSAVQTGLNKAGNQAIADTLKTVVADPQVQTAIVQSGNDAAINDLAAKLKAAQTSTITAVKNNPYTTMAIIGALGIGAVGLFYFIAKR